MKRCGKCVNYESIGWSVGKCSAGIDIVLPLWIAIRLDKHSCEIGARKNARGCFFYEEKEQ